MSKMNYAFFLVILLITITQFSFAQCPTDPAKGFQVFVEKSASLTALESEGPIAIGEDLTINGNYQVAVKSAGSFYVNNSLISLLVSGKVNYKAGNTFQINNGYVKIGNLENSKVWLIDDNGAYNNMQICNGNYNSVPRIQLLNKAKYLNTSDSKKEVEDKDLIDFGKAMETMRISSKSLGSKSNNILLTDQNDNPVIANKYPTSVKCNLNNGINFLNISGNDLNSISELICNNKPDANHVLVFNVDAKDVFNWQVWKHTGIGINECPYILYNFYNTTTLNIEGSNSIEGTVFAPDADIHKNKNNADIEGQIIGISYEQEEGENHVANFDADAEEKGCKKPTVAAITGNNSVCIGLKTTLSSVTEDGVWSTNAINIASVNNNGVVTGVAKGNFIISYSVTNKCGTTTVTSAMTASDCGNVNSGNTGGLESKSLGVAVAKRLFTAATNSELVMKPYQQLSVLKQELITKHVTGISAQINLFDLFPKQLSNAAITPYITTPSDIVSITNAKAVASSDYTLNGTCKAVVFATRTQSAIYDHTKAVCDRLKGGIIQNIEKINLLGFDMLRYNMKYEDGHEENIINFSAGTKTGRNSFTIQSNWLKNDYVPEDDMYNFQVWGVSTDILGEIAQKILEQLSSIAALEQPYIVKPLPKTYIMGANNDGGEIKLNLQNTGQNVSGYFDVFENANEKSVLVTKKNIPFSISASSNTILKLPASDIYESTIKMYLNDSLIDEIFISDGAWNTDYVAANTVVNKFEIMNDPKRLISDEFPVFRNIHLEATTNTYVSAYKLLRGGGISKDLTGFKTFKFTAAGNSVLNITLVKSSINKWEDQYALHIPISSDTKDYNIDLNDFISTATKDKINPNDINSIVFTMGSTNGSMTIINTTLSNVSFSKESLTYLEALKSKVINVYPNPTSGKFYCVFNSDKAIESNLMVTDAYSGIRLYSKTISIEKGENKIPIDISTSYQTAAGGTCVISIKNSETNYSSKKLIIKPN
jgi:choice-of-anchor A domain-containing protein